uniref:Transmembrane protein 11 n=2 Tax=Bovidae TaxID=9895 RepID=A0A8C2P827_CAPHI
MCEKDPKHLGLACSWPCLQLPRSATDGLSELLSRGAEGWDVMTGQSCSMSMWASGSWTYSTQRSLTPTVGAASPSTWPRVSLSATDCYIVHEIYNGENAQDQFEYELEQALEAQYKYIVIEPTRIGDETARWITVGNCLHKTTVLAGTACLFTPLALPLDYSHYISLPAGVLSLACCTLYGISWQFDPCCKYQVEYDAYRLSRLPLHTLTSSTPVVLVRKDDLHRKRLHNTIALAALVYCVKKIYELCAV